jgi:hypothetical protein
MLSENVTKAYQSMQLTVSYIRAAYRDSVQNDLATMVLENALTQAVALERTLERLATALGNEK